MTVYNLKNIFYLKKKTLFIKIYCLLFGYEKKKKSRIYRLLTKIFYTISKSIFLSIAFNKLKNKNSKRLYIETKTSPKRFFYVRETNSQFHSIYFPKFKDCYEPDVTFAIIALLPEKGTFIDIGCNWGHHVFTAALEKQAKVICFEPNPIVFGDLSQIVNQLNLGSQIFCYKKALSNKKKGKITLSQISFESGMASASPNFIDNIVTKSLSITYKVFTNIFKNKSINYEVEVGIIDEFNIQKIDLMKIDVEGLEYEILQGSINTIKDNQPIIIFEYFSNNQNHLENYFYFFNKLNYVLISLKTEKLLDKSFYKLKGNKIKSHYDLNPKEQYNLIAFHSSKLEYIESKLEIL